MIQYIKRFDPFLVTSVIIFLSFFVYTIGAIPYLDGNIEFVQSIDFLNGGFQSYFANWNSVHPPFKLLFTFLCFLFFGTNIFAYSLTFPIFGVIGILSLFSLTKDIFGKPAARTASFLLATSPLFVASSLFGLRDFIITSLLVLCFFLYHRKKYFLFLIFSAFAILTKETALLLPLAILLIELFFIVRRRFKNVELKKLFFLISPFIIYLGWVFILKINNKEQWQEWIFADTADKGTFFTIFHNLITLNFFNEYGIQGMLQLFFLNFNWFYFSTILVSLSIFLTKTKGKIIKDLKGKEIVYSLILFFALYVLSVLSLQTYKIPRYSLPLYPIFIFFFSASFVFLQKYFIKSLLQIILFSIVFLSLFFSVDPISILIWEKKTKVFNEKLYSLNSNLAGNDGITYNFQYLKIVKKRTKFLLGDQGINCSWVFQDINNDVKTLEFLKIESQNVNFCLR